MREGYVTEERIADFLTPHLRQADPVTILDLSRTMTGAEELYVGIGKWAGVTGKTVIFYTKHLKIVTRTVAAEIAVVVSAGIDTDDVHDLAVPTVIAAKVEMSHTIDLLSLRLLPVGTLPPLGNRTK